MSLAKEIRELMIEIETSSVTSESVYRILTLSMLKIDELEHLLRVAKDKESI